tara:strand:+ start:1921 stop:2073 length:153 start_codon:yes stop_codon:yes gene_type:complete
MIKNWVNMEDSAKEAPNQRKRKNSTNFRATSLHHTQVTISQPEEKIKMTI